MSSLQSAALARVKPSATLAVTRQGARAEARRAATSSAWAPASPTSTRPDNIKDAAIEAIRDGKTKYTDVDGMPELKAAIVAKFARENGLTYKPSPDPRRARAASR